MNKSNQFSVVGLAVTFLALILLPICAEAEVAAKEADAGAAVSSRHEGGESRPGLVGAAEDLEKRLSIVEEKLESAVTSCRVCFRETEGSPGQCGGSRNTCSGWAGVDEGADAGWTEGFRDDTDGRTGGCTYQWRLECR